MAAAAGKIKVIVQSLPVVGQAVGEMPNVRTQLVEMQTTLEDAEKLLSHVKW